MMARAALLLNWLMARPERSIALVSHKHTLKYVLALTAQSDTLTTVMDNAELRSFMLCRNPDRVLLDK